MIQNASERWTERWTERQRRVLARGPASGAQSGSFCPSALPRPPESSHVGAWADRLIVATHRPFVTSHHPFSCVSKATWFLGSWDLLPIFSSLIPCILPPARDAVTLPIFQFSWSRLFSPGSAVPQDCAGFCHGSEQEQLVANNLDGVPGEPRGAKCFSHSEMSHRDPWNALGQRRRRARRAEGTCPAHYWWEKGQPRRPNSRAVLSPSQGSTC